MLRLLGHQPTKSSSLSLSSFAHRQPLLLFRVCFLLPGRRVKESKYNLAAFKASWRWCSRKEQVSHSFSEGPRFQLWQVHIPAVVRGIFLIGSAFELLSPVYPLCPSLLCPFGSSETTACPWWRTDVVLPSCFPQTCSESEQRHRAGGLSQAGPSSSPPQPCPAPGHNHQAEVAPSPAVGSSQPGQLQYPLPQGLLACFPGGS